MSKARAKGAYANLLRHLFKGSVMKSNITGSNLSPQVKLAMVLLVTLVLARLGAVSSEAQPPKPMPPHVKTFIETYLPLARAQYKQYGIPVSVQLAQAAIETFWGSSEIMVSHNNFFAITNATHSPRATGTYQVWVEGKLYTYTEYATAEDAWLDFGYFLLHDPNYSSALRYLSQPRVFYEKIYCIYTKGTEQCDASTALSIWDDWTFQYDLKQDDAQFVAQSVYPTVQPGQSFRIYFEVKNTGFGTWRRDENYYLANINNTSLGANPRQELDSDVPPEAIKRWTISMIAPYTPGTYRTQWMLKHGDATFGPNMFIDVTAVTKPEDGWRRIIERIRQALERLIEDLRRKLEEIMEDWQRRMEQEMEKAIQRFLENLERELERAIQEACGGPAALLVGVRALIFATSRQSGRKR
jgi:hypothetical protein